MYEVRTCIVMWGRAFARDTEDLCVTGTVQTSQQPIQDLKPGPLTICCYLRGRVPVGRCASMLPAQAATGVVPLGSVMWARRTSPIFHCLHIDNDVRADHMPGVLDIDVRAS